MAQSPSAPSGSGEITRMKTWQFTNGHENDRKGYFVPESHIAFSGTKYAAGSHLFPHNGGDL
jgi:hypothetical protein